MRSASTSRIAFALVAFLARTTCAFNLYAPTSTFASFRSGRYSSHVQQRLGVSGLHSSSSGLEAGQPVPDERSASVRKGLGGYRIAGPDTPTPSFAQTDRRIFNKFAIQLFRNGMVNAIGEDVRTPGYSGLMELALKLNRRVSNSSLTPLYSDFHKEYVSKLMAKLTVEHFTVLSGGSATANAKDSCLFLPSIHFEAVPHHVCSFIFLSVDIVKEIGMLKIMQLLLTAEILPASAGSRPHFPLFPRNSTLQLRLSPAGVIPARATLKQWHCHSPYRVLFFKGATRILKLSTALSWVLEAPYSLHSALPQGG
jgi:hypothetical protein